MMIIDIFYDPFRGIQLNAAMPIFNGVFLGVALEVQKERFQRLRVLRIEMLPQPGISFKKCGKWCNWLVVFHQPLWKKCSSTWVHLPQVGVKIKQIETTT